MAEVKCTALQAVSLPDGRLLPPGRHAKNVDLEHPEVAAHLANRGLVVLDETSEADVPDGTVGDVLDWVGDKTARALQALDLEQRQDRPRSTLIDQLEQLVADHDTTKKE